VTFLSSFDLTTMKRNAENLSVMSDASHGPLLGQLVSIHRLNEEALEVPHLNRLAAVLSAHCRELGSPAVWPVGEAAARLAGAAVVFGDGDVKLRGWVGDVRDVPVLLASLAAATPLEMIQAATHARALGVSCVHAWGWNVEGLDSPDLTVVFDSSFKYEDELGGASLRLAG
jgi:hypothetical protein